VDLNNTAVAWIELSDEVFAEVNEAFWRGRAAAYALQRLGSASTNNNPTSPVPGKSFETEAHRDAPVWDRSGSPP